VRLLIEALSPRCGGATFTTSLPVVNDGARQEGRKFDAWSLAVEKAGAIYVAMSTNNWQVKPPNVPVGFVLRGTAR
jgi:hypothetical protein